MECKFRAALVLFVSFCLACQPDRYQPPSGHLLASMGSKYRLEYESAADALWSQFMEDSSNFSAAMEFAEMNVLLYIFGLKSRASTIPLAERALYEVKQVDSLSTETLTLQAILYFLNWEWSEAKQAFERAIQANPNNAKARHWYSLWLVSMTGDFSAAMQQSDTIMSLDPSGDYQIGRGSLLYFARSNMELKELMLQTIELDPEVPWGYDWLGMAYCELEEFEASVETYHQAFELSDGLVEVGGGLGHALGLAGAHEPAKYMANYYDDLSGDHYLPPVQRAFIHLGIGEYDQALALLEQAYLEKSWFIIFMQIEPWYDPIRSHPRFLKLVDRMNYPVNLLSR